MANAFNQHFASIGSSQLSELSYSTTTNIVNNISFSFSTIYPSEVLQVISEIKSSNGAGPDGLDMKFIKLSSHVLAVPLCDLFNLSLSTCVIPLMWKFAKVIPLHKGGDSLEVNNYRPISIINNVAKIFEKLIFRQLSKYINDFSLLSPNQSGFRPHHSTTTALTLFTNYIFSAQDNNRSTGAIFIDLTKAFDMVNHYILLDKLYAIGLSKSAVLWFNSYLHYRCQSVSFNDVLSQTRIIETGVPQGSSLGPLLFSIFINDLPQLCSDCQIHLYADDTVVYTSSYDISKIQTSLQFDFNLIQTWFSSNLLLLNKNKSYSMLFATRSALHKQNNSLHVKFVDGTPLKNVEEFKYLGLWLDSQLTFRTHIDSIVKNINCSLRILYRSINCFTKQIRLKIITQLLLPIIDYADVVYQNTADLNLKPLNVIYNSICRFVLRCPFRTHHCQMYQSLNLLSLNSRRQFHWLQFVYKCIFSNYPSYLKQYLIPYQTSYSLRDTDYLFFSVPKISKESGRRAFKFKAPSDWNALPRSFRSISSFYQFNMSLLNHLHTSCNCFPNV